MKILIFLTTLFCSSAFADQWPEIALELIRNYKGPSTINGVLQHCNAIRGRPFEFTETPDPSLRELDRLGELESGFGIYYLSIAISELFELGEETKKLSPSLQINAVYLSYGIAFFGSGGAGMTNPGASALLSILEESPYPQVRLAALKTLEKGLPDYFTSSKSPVKNDIITQRLRHLYHSETDALVKAELEEAFRRTGRSLEFPIPVASLLSTASRCLQFFLGR